MIKDLTSEEAGRWMDAAPPLVQEVVTSPTTQQVVEQIGRQYALHIDVIDNLMRLVSYMLVGYVGPVESLQELHAAGIPDQQARQIIADINQKIFVPLRLKMQQATIPAPQPPPVRPAPSIPQPAPTQAPVPSYAPHAQPQKHFHLENKIPPPTPQPRPTPPQGNLVAAIAAAKPVNIGRLLEDHEEPHIDIRDKVQGVSLPGSQPPIPVPSSASPTSHPLPLKPSVRPYSVDPYREPVDES